MSIIVLALHYVALRTYCDSDLCYVESREFDSQCSLFTVLISSIAIDVRILFKIFDSSRSLSTPVGLRSPRAVMSRVLFLVARVSIQTEWQTCRGSTCPRTPVHMLPMQIVFRALRRVPGAEERAKPRHCLRPKVTTKTWHLIKEFGNSIVRVLSRVILCRAFDWLCF